MGSNQDVETEFAKRLRRFTRLYSIKYILSITLIYLEQIKTSSVNVSSCESDWISYSDKKCFKILNSKGTEVEAKANCSLLDNSTLITIDSKSEQDYLNEHLKSYRSIADNVWIGLEYVSSSFHWMDGTQYRYENWGENAIKDGSNRCVQMSLTESELGLWTDDNCNKKFLFVCQKKQSSKSVIEDQIKNLTNFVEKQDKSLDEEITSLKIEITNLKGNI